MQHAYPLKHPLPLSLLQHLTSSSFTPDQRQDVSYLSNAQLQAIAEMDLLRLGRLSVQTVSQEAWDALSLMGDKGGWREWQGKWNTGNQGKGKKEADGQVKPAAKRKKGDEEPQAESEAKAQEKKPAAPKADLRAGGEGKIKAAKKQAVEASPPSDSRRKSTRIAKAPASLANGKSR